MGGRTQYLRGQGLRMIYFLTRQLMALFVCDLYFFSLVSHTIKQRTPPCQLAFNLPDVSLSYLPPRPLFHSSPLLLPQMIKTAVILFFPSLLPYQSDSRFYRMPFTLRIPISLVCLCEAQQRHTLTHIAVPVQ